jgi:hypothetical protein
MSAADQDFEKRLSALEEALALPSSSTSAATVSTTSSEAAARIAALEKQLARANYRIKHLVRAYDEQRARADSALAAQKKQ